MSRTTKVTPGAAAKAAEGNAFKPLPAGIVNATIFEHSAAEIKKGDNVGVTGLNIQFRISDGQKGANRRIFTHVWETEKWASGSVNFLYFQFYKALGVEFKDADGNDLEEVELPDLEDLNGSPLALKLKVVPDDYQYKKALAEWEGLEPAEDSPKYAAWKQDKPSKGDYLKNEVAEFLPEQDDLPDAEDESPEDDESGFDL